MATKTAMRIIVATALNSGAAEYKNMGDVAMLQVAIKRLTSLWPDARIDVLTDSPSDLARYCPSASALPREGCACWMVDHILLGKYHQLLPTWISQRLSALKWAIGIRWPVVLDHLTLLKLRRRDPKGLLDSLSVFLEAQKDCELMVVCGSGGFTDSSRGWNLFVLGAMTGVLARGTKVAMLGQGIGPLSDPLVLSWARRVLPRVSLIGLRGTKGGQQLLEELNVSPSSILTTGDDAIELACEVRVKAQRCAIGINLRAAPYSEVNAKSVADIRSVVQECAKKYEVDLLPVPITFHDYANDCETIRQLLAGFKESDGGATLNTPRKVLEQIARCRIVITGAYHAAVFALAQGIPAICLSNSSYYSAKFEGLKEHFPVGCWVVSLSKLNSNEELGLAIEDAWMSADNVRQKILNSAQMQVQASQAAYRQLRDLLMAQP